MSVVYPKLAEGYRWYVTEPTGPPARYAGKVQIQKKGFFGWDVVAEQNYYPDIWGTDRAIERVIKFLDPSSEYRKQVGPH